MAYKIVLDVGHGGEDPGAVYKDRKEKDDNLKLTLAVGKILEENGVDVVYTRTTDIYQTPFEKAKAANEAGADFFISFHRNSSSKPEQYNGVEVLVYDKKGIKYQMAQNILGALGELGFRELGVKERPGLVVLRRTKMPALLVETGFINSEKDNQLFEKKFEEIARSIAEHLRTQTEPSAFLCSRTCRFDAHLGTQTGRTCCCCVAAPSRRCAVTMSLPSGECRRTRNGPAANHATGPFLNAGPRRLNP